MRTPTRSRASSFGTESFGDHGYSQASSVGVAQYEFGIGRGVDVRLCFGRVGEEVEATGKGECESRDMIRCYLAVL